MKQAQSNDCDSEVMDDRQAAALLQISTKTLRKLRQTNQVPHALVLGQVRYLRTDLVEWLRAGGTNQINQTNSKGNI